MVQLIPERLSALRREMKRQRLDAFIVPSNDPHQSEYVAPHWKAREWLSGFTGSAGVLVVTADHAGLWTDSRYFLQAEQELKGTGIELHRQVVPHAPEHIPWLAEHLAPKSKVACDGYLFSIGQIRHMEEAFRQKRIAIDYTHDPISAIWKDRPGLPATKIFEHDVFFTGLTRLEKLNLLAEKLEAQQADFQLITTLDDIAWTLNIRASDVPFNPVCIGYLVVGQILSYFFIDEGRIPFDLQQQMLDDGVMVKPYSAIEEFLNELPARKRILIDAGATNIRLFDAIPARKRLMGDNIPRQLKAVKNEVEIGHIRRAMVKDGVALTRLFRWLEQELHQRTVPEVEVAEQLQSCRRQQGDYAEESFPAIVGYNSNGAIIHYTPEPETCADIYPEGILLLDSGGQYLHGTTDITRTIALGSPTKEQQRNFTLVLKGYIALDQVKFPAGTTGAQLDAFARQFLWQYGLNYGHGTGHGVGFFLNVHEPPQGFATSAVTSRGSTAFKAGMLTSNEPGYYKTGAYGIRTENLILCVEAEETESGKFLCFETLTLFPIDQELIDRDLLTREEVQWLNDYHAQVFQTLAPHLNEEEQNWLREKCSPVS